MCKVRGCFRTSRRASDRLPRYAWPARGTVRDLGSASVVKQCLCRRRSFDSSEAPHAARCVACQGVRPHPVPVALVGECSIKSKRPGRNCTEAFAPTPMELDSPPKARR